MKTERKRKEEKKRKGTYDSIQRKVKINIYVGNRDNYNII